MRLLRKGRTDGNPAIRIFFATDIHGSDKCFRKFINAAAFYEARYIILGGDITGKTIAPIWKTATGWSAKYFGRTYEDMTEEERRQLEQKIRDNGQYPVVGEQDELNALEDSNELERHFATAVVEGIERWMSFADSRLAGTDVRCFVTPGNDDYWDIDRPIKESATVEFVEGRCVRLDDDHEMITTGVSNITPWASPRELSEDKLRSYIDKMFNSVADPANLIVVLHAPPHGTALDRAPEIDEDFRVQAGSGGMKMAHVGSSAVRSFVEEHQPLLGLHGHVHESKGAENLGRTVCINPGSEYTDGVLSGALVTIRRDKIGFQFVAG